MAILSERQKLILALVIRDYIDTAHRLVPITWWSTTTWMSVLPRCAMNW
jgi:hypothetical protein